MPRVMLKPDTLDQENRKFAQERLTAPIFLNSVPKCGSHLLRNIFRMFVPVEQQYQMQFIQWPNLQKHLAAFDPKACNLSWGHLLFSDASAFELAGVRKIILVRDPYDWVLARARFFLSDEFISNIENVKSGVLTISDLLNLMIFGVYNKAPPMIEIYNLNAVAWLGADAKLIRYEDLIKNLKALDSDDAEQFFADMFAHCGIKDLPDDWRERVRIGSDRKQSGTARENLTGPTLDMPDELPDAQKHLVDYVAPGLRQILGYD